MSRFVRSGAAAGLLWGALLGISVCYLEAPFPRYTLVGSELIIEAVRRILSPEFARILDRPFHLFLLYILAGGAGGVLIGAAASLLSKLSRRRPDKRRRIFLVHLLFLAVLLYGYLALVLLHFRFPRPTTLVGLAALLPAALLPAFLVAAFLARIVPPEEGGKRGSGVLVSFAVLLFLLILSFGATNASRGIPVVDRPPETKSGEKVVLLCVDGIGWSLVDPLLEAGKLPAFSRLLERGSRGILRSTLPPIQSPVVWTSVATDRLPRDHGVHGFVSRSPKTGIRISTNNRVRRRTTYWEILTRCGRSVDVLSWYPSWPPDPIAGVMLSSRAVYDGIPERVYPESYEGFLDSLLQASRSELSTLRDRVTTYEPSLDPDRPGDGGSAAMRRRAVGVMDQAFVRDHVTLAFAERLIERGQPDFLAIYFRGTDTVQHKFRKYHAARKDPWVADLLYDVSPEEVEELGGVIDAYLIFVDDCISRILDRLDPKTAVLLVSDHAGGYRHDGEIRMSNALLYRLGYSSGGFADQKARSRASSVWDAKAGVLRVYINLEGREESGIVPRSEFPAALSDLRESLAALRTEEGTPLFRSIREGEKSGGRGGRGDLLAELDPQALGGKVRIDGEAVPVSEFAYRFTKSGNHRISGVLIASGGPFRPGKRIRGGTIYDILPTLFHVLGLPLAKDWEGKILTSLLDERFRKSWPVTWVETYETGEGGRGEIEPELDGANEQVLEELKALGYIQ